MITLFDEEKIAEIHDYHVAQAARVKGTLSNLKSLMETMGWSIDTAMHALDIPEDERQKYLNQLEQPQDTASPNPEQIITIVICTLATDFDFFIISSVFARL